LIDGLAEDRLRKQLRLAPHARPYDAAGIKRSISAITGPMDAKLCLRGKEPECLPYGGGYGDDEAQSFRKIAMPHFFDSKSQ